MNRRNWLTAILGSVAWLVFGRKAQTAQPDVLGYSELYVRPAKASAQAWSIATPEGTLVPKVTPRCKVFVDGKQIEYSCFADLKAGAVERYRHDLFEPQMTEIPTSWEYGFIDVELLDVTADAPRFTKVWLGANNYATVDEWKALNAARNLQVRIPFSGRNQGSRSMPMFRSRNSFPLSQNSLNANLADPRKRKINNYPARTRAPPIPPKTSRK